MRFIYKLVSIAIFVFAFLYFMLYLAFYFKTQEINLSNNKSFLIKSTGSEVSFDKINPHISPFSIGIKVTGISEKIKNYQITHQEPLYIGFNPFTFKIKAEYAGKSFATNNYDATDSLSIDSDISLTLNMYVDLKTLLFLIKSKPVKLINYIKNTSLEYKKLKVYSNKTSSNIFEAKNTKFTLITNHDYYKNLSDIITNPPKYYSLSGILNIENSTNKKNLAPFSIIYGLVPNFDIKGAFFVEIDSAEKTFKINKPFDNAKTRFICSKCSSSKLDLDISSKFDSVSEDIKVDLSADIVIKKGFFTDMPLWYNQVLKIVDGFDHEAALILGSPDKYLPPIDYSSKFSIKTSGVLNIKDHSIKASINNLILKSSSGAGIMLKGNGDLNARLDYNLDGNIVITNANSIIKYWGDYFYQNIKHMPDNDREIIDFNNDVNALTAKQLSEYPKSTSNDYLYSVVINSTDNKFLICDKSLTDITFTYYKVKTQVLLEKASKSQDPLKYIIRVTPELEQVASELIKQIPEKTKISDELWQKLTE